VLAQRSFGLDMRSFVLFGLLLGAPSGVRVPETVHTARDLLRRRGWERGMIRRWRCG
jgi:hypothetical protein